MTYPTFPKHSPSILAKHLSLEIFELLKNKTTANGFTLKQAINSGVVNSDSEIGIYAGDAESYETFAPLFDKIIEDYHGFGKEERHHSNLNPNDLIIESFDENYVLSTRIRVGRNLEAFPLGAGISKEQRNGVECLVSEALCLLEGEFSSFHNSSCGMPIGVQTTK